MTTKNIARYVTIGALFIIPFLSLYVSNGLYFPFISGKNFGFRILVDIAFAGWLVLAACDKRYRPRFSWTILMYKLLVIWMFIVDVFFAVNSHKALWSNYERMDGWVTLIHLLVFAVVASAVFSTDNLWRKWWLAFSASSALVTLYGLAQMLGITAIHQGSTRIDSTLGNAEYLAGYLLFSIAITLWQAFETRDKSQVWLKWSLFALAVVELVVLFATGTRGALIALIGAGIVGSVLWMIEAGKQGRRGAGIVFAILIVIVGGLFLGRNSSFVQHSPNVERLASVFSLKEALGPRLTIWHMAVEGIEQKPITGWGQEGFNYVFNTYYEPSLYAQEPWFDRAHNMFLDWGIAGGLPALILFLLVLGFAITALYRAPVSRYERIFLLSAIAGYMISGLVVFDNLFTYMPFVMILAMAHSLTWKPIRFFERMREVKGSQIDTIVAPAALIVGILLAWFINVPSVEAGSDLISGLTPTNSAEARLGYFKSAVNRKGLAHQEITEQIISYAPQAAADSSVSQQTRQDIVTYAGEQMNAELARVPQDARLHIQYALFFRAIGDIADAETESAHARSLTPNKQNIILEQGIEAFQDAKYAAAQTYFEQAYQLDTRDTDIVPYIAATHIASKDVVGAKAILQKTFGTTTIDSPILLLAYYQISDWNDLILVIQAKLQNSNDATTGFQLAAAYSQAGRRADAIAQIQTTIAAHPESAAQGEALLQQLDAVK